MVNVNELACAYSALILADGGVDVSPDHITKLLKAANVTVDSLWPTLFASALKSVNIKDLVKSAGSAAPAAPTVTATTAATTAAAPVEKKEEKEEKKEESDEDDGDMGFGLFD